MKKIMTLLALMMSVYSLQATRYDVASPEALADALNNDMDEYKEIYLTDDISLQDVERFSVDEKHAFYGVFDGQGHTLKGFALTGNTDHAALFGFTGRGFSARATFRNLVIEDFQVEGNSYVAFLVANPKYTLFENIKVVNHYPLLCSDKYCGAIAARAADCVFKLCTVSGNSYIYAGNSILGPAGDASIGGICGHANDCLFYRCVNQSDVYSHNQYTGGICGNLQDSSIHSCVNTGVVSSGAKITDGNGAGVSVSEGKTLTECGANYKTGGLVGLICDGSIRNSIMTNSVKSGDKGITAIAGINLLMSNYGYIVRNPSKYSNNYFVDTDMSKSSDMATVISESVLQSGEIASALNSHQNTAFWRQESGEGFPNPTLDDFEESNSAVCDNSFAADDDNIIDVESLGDLSSDDVKYYDLNKRRIPQLRKGINIVKQGDKSYKVMVR